MPDSDTAKGVPGSVRAAVEALKEPMAPSHRDLMRWLIGEVRRLEQVRGLAEGEGAMTDALVTDFDNNRDLIRLADLVFDSFHEDAGESIDEPFVCPDGAGGLNSRFDAQRIMNTLNITDHATAKKYVVTVSEVGP